MHQGLRFLAKRSKHALLRVLLKSRIAAAKTPRHIEQHEVGNLRVFQYNIGSAQYYRDTIGHVPIRIATAPHAHFAKNILALADTGGEDAYRPRASWSAIPANRAGNIDGKVEAFRALIALHQKGQAVRLSRSHRYRAMTSLTSSTGTIGPPLPGQNQHLWRRSVPFDLVFARYLAPPEYYGAGHKGRPYQTIYFKGRPSITGRRTDILERVELIPRHVLANASVLDVGSNFGMNALAAAWGGAASVLGLEQSHKLANTATRLSVLNGLYPRVTFRQYDVDTDSLDAAAQFDTGFMFSVFQHLRDPGRLLQIADKHIRKFVAFEGHPGTTHSRYTSFLDSGLFTTVTLIGYLDHSASNTLTGRRPLWLCEK